MKKLITLLIVVVLTSVIFIDPVRADVVEEQRTISIPAHPDGNYDIILNILNKTNNNYTNAKLLVDPFVAETGFDGGFAGSFLPPAKFQLDSANTSSTNADLIIGSFVEFTRKNLLSGASESWWRCPYYFNASVAASRDWSVNLTIYHVDLPRQTNFTFPNSPSNNNPLPIDSTHPSIVFQRSYTNCGSTKDTTQWNQSVIAKIPTNDTLQNPDLPLDLNISSPNYNPYMYMIVDAYNTTVQYSFAWFNITAPIYPNTTYFVVWDVFDANMGANDAGACWITASDIGDNTYNKGLICWNSEIVYDIPIDMDSSVIFRVGLGDGVSGLKLDYNNPQYSDITSLVSNPSFEINDKEDDEFMVNTSWSPGMIDGTFGSGPTDDGYALIGSSYLNFYMQSTNQFTDSGNDNTAYMQRTYVLTDFDDGVTERLKVTFPDTPDYDSGSGGVQRTISNGGLYLENYYLGTHYYLEMAICRRTRIDPSNVVHRENFWALHDSSGWTIYNLPEYMPHDVYVVVDDDITTGYVHLALYDQDSSFTPFYRSSVLRTDTAFSLLSHFRIGGFAGEAGGILYAPFSSSYIPWSNVVKVNKWNIAERRIGGWTVVAESPSNIQSVAKHTFQPDNDFEMVIPSYSDTGIINENCLGMTQYSLGTSYGYVDQLITVSLSDKRFYTSCYYKLDQPYLPRTMTGFFVTLTLGLRATATSIWTYTSQYGYSVDSAWHKISTVPTSVGGSIDRVSIQLRTDFPSSVTTPHGSFGYFDNVTLESITANPIDEYVFRQRVDQIDFNSTNYYSLLIPIKHETAPVVGALAIMDFKNSAGTTIYTHYTTFADWYDDFILSGVNTSKIPSLTTYCEIRLWNFGENSYIFLQDRNSDFVINDKVTYVYNHIFERNTATPSTIIYEYFMSPYYSLGVTEGVWTNADSYFTTTYFYYVRVHFVRFNDTDPEILFIKMYNVDVEDFDIFTMKLNQFGQVLQADEWLSYMEWRNRPGYLDMVWDGFMALLDWLANSPIGQFFSAIGKMIFDILNFLVPLLESLVHVLITILVFLIAIFVYMTTAWIMHKFTNFWILVGEGEAESAIDELNMTTSKITSAAVSLVPKKGG